MTTNRSLPATSAQARPVVRWVFRRNQEAITCEVVNAAGTCEVRTVPAWNPALAVVEPFARPVDALQRHAEVAARLRDLGWGAADHVPVAA
jgi:hypothetical protein